MSLDYFILWMNGDERGFTHFYNEYYSGLKRDCLDIVKDEYKAEDIVSEAWIRVWSKRQELKFENEKMLKAYVYAAVKNRSLNALQSEKNHLSTEDVDIPVQDAGIEDSLNQKQKVQGITKFLKYLPTECRRIMQLIFVDGFSVRETSDSLRLSISTIKNQKYRGINIIKDIMSGKRKAETKEETSEFASLVIPEAFDGKWLKENIEVVKLVIPQMSKLYKGIIKMYAEEDEAALLMQRYKFRKKDGKRYHSSIFYRTKKRAFNELKKRLSFEKEYGEISEREAADIVMAISKMRDTDKMVISEIIDGKNDKQIAASVKLSERSVRNAAKMIVGVLVKIYPHPSLEVANQPACIKLRKFFNAHKKTVTCRVARGGLTISGRKKYTWRKQAA